MLPQCHDLHQCQQQFQCYLNTQTYHLSNLHGHVEETAQFPILDLHSPTNRNHCAKNEDKVTTVIIPPIIRYIYTSY